MQIVVIIKWLEATCPPECRQSSIYINLFINSQINLAASAQSAI